MNNISKLSIYLACKDAIRVKSAGLGRELWDIGKEVGGDVINQYKNQYTYAYDPQHEALARQINDSNYLEALEAINNGEYNGYNPHAAVDSNRIDSIGVTDKQLDEMSDRRMKRKEQANNRGSSTGITINNNMPSGSSGGGGYSGGAAEDYTPGLADYMRSYVMNKYRTR